jgi:LEA14-like dessication related protein
MNFSVFTHYGRKKAIRPSDHFVKPFLIAAIWWGTGGKKIFRNELSSFAPEVKITSIYISDIDEHNVTIVGNAIIKNRFPARLVADSLDYDLYIDSVQVLHSGHIKKISIPAEDQKQ